MVLIARAAEPTLPGWLGFTMMKRTRENTAGEPVSGAETPSEEGDLPSRDGSPMKFS